MLFDLGFCLYWVEGGMARVSRVYSLLVKLKLKSGNYDVRRGKSGVTQSVSYLGQSGLSKRGISRCFAGNCVIKVTLCLLEVNVSVSAIETLVSGAYITIKKFIRHLYYIHIV